MALESQMKALINARTSNFYDAINAEKDADFSFLASDLDFDFDDDDESSVARKVYKARLAHIKANGIIMEANMNLYYTDDESSAYFGYSYEEILGLANGGASIPEEILNWAQQMAELAPEEATTDTEGGTAHELYTSLKNNPLLNIKTITKIFVNKCDEKTEELEAYLEEIDPLEKEMEAVRVQAEEAKEKAMNEIKSALTEWKELQAKMQRGQQLTQDEQTRFEELQQILGERDAEYQKDISRLTRGFAEASEKLSIAAIKSETANDFGVETVEVAKEMADYERAHSVGRIFGGLVGAGFGGMLAAGAAAGSKTFSQIANTVGINTQHFALGVVDTIDAVNLLMQQTADVAVFDINDPNRTVQSLASSETFAGTPIAKSKSQRVSTNPDAPGLGDEDDGNTTSGISTPEETPGDEPVVTPPEGDEGGEGGVEGAGSDGEAEAEGEQNATDEELVADGKKSLEEVNARELSLPSIKRLIREEGEDTELKGKDALKLVEQLKAQNANVEAKQATANESVEEANAGATDSTVTEEENEGAQNTAISNQEEADEASKEQELTVASLKETFKGYTKANKKYSKDVDIADDKMKDSIKTGAFTIAGGGSLTTVGIVNVVTGSNMVAEFWWCPPIVALGAYLIDMGVGEIMVGSLMLAGGTALTVSAVEGLEINSETNKKLAQSGEDIGTANTQLGEIEEAQKAELQGSEGTEETEEGEGEGEVEDETEEEDPIDEADKTLAETDAKKLDHASLRRLIRDEGVDAEKKGQEALELTESFKAQQLTVDKLQSQYNDKVKDANENSENGENGEDAEGEVEGAEGELENAETGERAVYDKLKDTFKDFKKVNKKYTKDVNYAEGEMVKDLVLATGTTGFGGFVTGVGIANVVEGTTLISTGTPMLSNPFTAAAGAAMVSAGTGLVSVGSGEITQGGLLIASGMALSIFATEGMEIDANTMKQLTESNENIGTAEEGATEYARENFGVEESDEEKEDDEDVVMTEQELRQRDEQHLELMGQKPPVLEAFQTLVMNDARVAREEANKNVKQTKDLEGQIPEITAQAIEVAREKREAEKDGSIEDEGKREELEEKRQRVMGVFAEYQEDFVADKVANQAYEQDILASDDESKQDKVVAKLGSDYGVDRTGFGVEEIAKGTLLLAQWFNPMAIKLGMQLIKQGGEDVGLGASMIYSGLSLTVKSNDTLELNTLAQGGIDASNVMTDESFAKVTEMETSVNTSVEEQLQADKEAEEAEGEEVPVEDVMPEEAEESTPEDVVADAASAEDAAEDAVEDDEETVEKNAEAQKKQEVKDKKEKKVIKKQNKDIKKFEKSATKGEQEAEEIEQEEDELAKEVEEKAAQAEEAEGSSGQDEAETAGAEAESQLSEAESISDEALAIAAEAVTFVETTKKEVKAVENEVRANVQQMKQEEQGLQQDQAKLQSLENQLKQEENKDEGDEGSAPEPQPASEPVVAPAPKKSNKKVEEPKVEEEEEEVEEPTTPAVPVQQPQPQNEEPEQPEGADKTQFASDNEKQPDFVGFVAQSDSLASGASLTSSKPKTNTSTSVTAGSNASNGSSNQPASTTKTTKKKVTTTSNSTQSSKDDEEEPTIMAANRSTQRPVDITKMAGGAKGNEKAQQLRASMQSIRARAFNRQAKLTSLSIRTNNKVQQNIYKEAKAQAEAAKKQRLEMEKQEKIAKIKEYAGYVQGVGGLTSMAGMITSMVGKGQVTAGTAQVTAGTTQISTGTSTLATGVGMLSAATGLVTSGTTTIAVGGTLLTVGATQVGVGTATVTVGTTTEAVGITAQTVGSALIATGTPMLSNPFTAAAGAALVASGTTTTISGTGTEGSGLALLASGATSLSTGAMTISTGSSTTAFGSSQVGIGTATIASANATMQSGLAQISLGAGQVAAGTATIASGTATIATGETIQAIGAYTTAAGAATSAGADIANGNILGAIGSIVGAAASVVGVSVPMSSLASAGMQLANSGVQAAQMLTAGGGNDNSNGGEKKKKKAFKLNANTNNIVNKTASKKQSVQNRFSK